MRVTEKAYDDWLANLRETRSIEKAYWDLALDTPSIAVIVPTPANDHQPTDLIIVGFRVS